MLLVSDPSVIYSIGIDPGWKNLGIALVKEEAGKISLVQSAAINPSSFKVQLQALETFKAIKAIPEGEVNFLTMERYVSYQNVMTAESENILMLIGALRQFAGTWVTDSDILLLRAIEWKMELVKTLVKNRGFDNPSTSLDKKFSIAAAHACLDIQGKFETDHEADAICLACLPLLRKRYGTKQPTK